MSAAQKYGKPPESMPSESLQQARAAGETLASKGVVQQSSLGTGSPAPTPAMKYGADSQSIQREIKPPSQSR